MSRGRPKVDRGRWWEKPEALPSELASLSREDLAHRAVADARKLGALTMPATCELCDKPARYGHHHSYLPEHWLDVAWVCSTHHGAIHAGKVAEPRTGLVRTKEQRAKGMTPDTMVRHLAAGGSPPKKSTQPERWKWAAAYLAVNPAPAEYSGDPRVMTPEYRLFLSTYVTWSRRIPSRWAGVDLSRTPERLLTVQGVLDDTTKLATIAARHDALVPLLQELDFSSVAA